MTSTIWPLPNFPPFASEWINVSSRSSTRVFWAGLTGIKGRGISCTAVLAVVMAKGVSGDCDVMDGVRGDVGDLRESAVLRRVNAANSSFSATD